MAGVGHRPVAGGHSPDGYPGGDGAAIESGAASPEADAVTCTTTWRVCCTARAAPCSCCWRWPACWRGHRPGGRDPGARFLRPGRDLALAGLWRLSGGPPPLAGLASPAAATARRAGGGHAWRRGQGLMGPRMIVVGLGCRPCCCGGFCRSKRCIERPRSGARTRTWLRPGFFLRLGAVSNRREFIRPSGGRVGR